MKLSVVIPAFNEAKLLGRCLASVAEAAAALGDRGGSYEIVVCDNNSTDATAEIAQAAGARVVFEPFNQISRARNHGAAAATGDWLLFLDADSTVSRELFADLAVAIADERCVGGGATVAMDNPSGATARLVHVWNALSLVVRWAPGGFLFCEATAFRELCGFSEELFVSEEIEFSRRLKRLARQRGKRILILSRHPFLTSSRKLQLYSRREFWEFLKHSTWSPLKTQRDRAACPIWYDGRR